MCAVRRLRASCCDEAYTCALRPGELARRLARIHAIDVEDARVRPAVARAARRRSAVRPLRVRRYRGFTARRPGWPRPALSAERWLLERAPACTRPALVHGDFRIGNVMFGEGLRPCSTGGSRTSGIARSAGWLAVRAWRFGRDRLAMVACAGANSGTYTATGAPFRAAPGGRSSATGSGRSSACCNSQSKAGAIRTSTRGLGRRVASQNGAIRARRDDARPADAAELLEAIGAFLSEEGCRPCEGRKLFARW